MLRHRKITLERLEKFFSKEYFVDVNLAGRIYANQRREVVVEQADLPSNFDRRAYERAKVAAFQRVELGQAFGPSWSTHWFRVNIEIPLEWRGKEVHFLWDSGCEAMIWENDEPQQGLTGGNPPERGEYILTQNAKGEERRTLYIEMACNGLFGCGEGLIQPPNENRTFTLRTAHIAVFNRSVWDLLWDFVVIVGMAKHLPEESQRSGQALFAANEILNVIFTDDPSTFEKAREIAKEFLASTNGKSQHEIFAVGHCHIDTAWLWPYDETRRKTARSWSSVTRYMEMNEYQEFTFACSQAQQFEWLLQDYPALFNKIKRFVEKGRFIPVGGTWVEMDGNIPSGESFVRQFLYGQRFFQEHFGVTCSVFWLPDTFGYSPQLPQIMKGVGITRFVTQKLSWNLINKMPNSTFWWEGLDGSRVLTHFPPADTYTSVVSVEQIVNSVNNFKDKERSKESLLLFGHGDGGGGPTMEMLERIARMKDVDGLPRVCNSTPDEFFNRLEQTCANKLLTWVGELYFELHQGTYTTQAKTKLNNRKGEFLLHDLEFIASVATLLIPAYSYPKLEIDCLWKSLLLNQFHDVLPGSSIEQVYKDTDEIYAKLTKDATNLYAAAMEAIIPPSQSNDHVTVWNTLPWFRQQVIELPPQSFQGALQTANNGNPLAVVNVNGFACSWLSTSRTIDETSSLKDKVCIEETIQGNTGSIVLENATLRVTLLPDGTVASLFLKSDVTSNSQGRDCFANNKPGNRFVLFEDIPFFWDAWDTMVYHHEKQVAVSSKVEFEIIERGPLRVAAKFKHILTPNCQIEQIISLSAFAQQVDFHTQVTWHENRRFLKVEFPFDVRPLNTAATYDVQFGHLTRPTHHNTSWDIARYEVVGHKWADVSEHGFGVALLNDCKYGYCCRGNRLLLSLLRAPKAPDANADMGHHDFTYSLFPHATSSPCEGGVIQAAYNLNVPLRVSTQKITALAQQLSHSFVSFSTPSVVIETIKLAEPELTPSASSQDQHKKHLLIRMYEAFGGTTSGRLILCSWLTVQRAAFCNLLEQEIAPLNWSDNPPHISDLFTLKAFEVLTVKLTVTNPAHNI